ncbi:MAG: hypothetical protein M3Y87_28875, partial [Myxococcota bacterium]|nr:hypothetical protein [Myxococcota bacterium]
MSRSASLRALSSILIAAASLVPSAALAQPLAPADVPEPLRPWIGWALDGDELRGCSWMIDGTQRCA